MPSNSQDGVSKSESKSVLEGDGREALAEQIDKELAKEASEYRRGLLHTIDALSENPTGQPEILNRLLETLWFIHATPQEIERINTALNTANTARMQDEASTQASIIPYFQAALGDLPPTPVTAIPTQRLAPTTIPPLEDAPKNTFEGVRVNGDPYKFLEEKYAPWLQEGMKCLDRPSLEKLDPKLLKALQQRYTRQQRNTNDANAMPPLSDIFPSKVQAARNRNKYCLTKGEESQKKLSQSS